MHRVFSVCFLTFLYFFFSRPAGRNFGANSNAAQKSPRRNFGASANAGGFSNNFSRLLNVNVFTRVLVHMRSHKQHRNYNSPCKTILITIVIETAYHMRLWLSRLILIVLAVVWVVLAWKRLCGLPLPSPVINVPAGHQSHYEDHQKHRQTIRTAA